MNGDQARIRGGGSGLEEGAASGGTSPAPVARQPGSSRSEVSKREGSDVGPKGLRDRFTPILLVLAALGAGLVLARQAAYGVAVSFDSINYLGVAEHLLEGRGFLNYDWGAYTLQPPLYPLLLAAASLGVEKPIEAAGLLNAGLFAATIFVLGRYFRRRVRSGWLAGWGAAAVALSLPLGDLASWALSETAFVLFTTLALVAADDFISEGRKRSLAGAAVFSALAWQTRYLGIVVPAVIAAALWFTRGVPLRRRLRRSGFVAAAAALPMAFWTARNYLAVGHFAGKRENPEQSFGALLDDVRVGFSEWFAFEMPGGSVAAVALPAVLVFTVTAFASDRRPRRSAPDRSPRSNGLRSAAIFLGFGGLYLFLVFGALLFGATGHGIESRFLAPLYIPFVVGAVFLADRALRSEGARPPDRTPGGGAARPRRWRRALGRKAESGLLLRLARGGLAAGLSILLSGQVAPTLAAVREANSASPTSWRGFAAPPWRDSETRRYLEENGFPGEIWTNLPRLLSLHHGMRAFFRYLPLSEDWTDWIEDREPGAVVVWFRNTPPNPAYDYGLGDLRGRAGLEPVAELSDGVVFRVNRDYAPPNPYREFVRDLAAGTAGEPVARGDFDLYLDGTTLRYFREPCAPEDTESRFFLHAYPADRALLSPSRAPYGFENLDFTFLENGVRFDGKCVVIVDLPDAALTRIRTGQYESGSPPLWSAEVSFPAPPEQE